MTQPDLGKKIADLRKAKSFTQEELVQKCNISVRTLQRIESGEGTPRGYTLRIIFEALDYSQLDSNEISSNKIGAKVFFRLEHFYRYFIDLFNLKTNTMKKLSILSISILIIVFGLFAISNYGYSQDKNDVIIKSSKLIGDDFRGFGVKAEKHIFDSISAKAIFRIKDELIAKDVIIVEDGVKIKSQLIRFDMSNKEFITVIFDGKLSSNSVLLILPKLAIENDSRVKYSGDKISKMENKLIISGNGKINIETESVEANEIIIQTN